MPDALPATPARLIALTADELIKLDRRPALPGYIARKVLAAGITDFRTRRAGLERCKAELSWAYADWLRIITDRGLGIDIGAEHDCNYGTPSWELTYLPHEQAAATALNIYGHLHTPEHRLRECILRLRAQRQAGWHEQASGGTVDDIRHYWRERRKAHGALLAAIRRYERLRAEIDCGPSAPACAKAA